MARPEDGSELSPGIVYFNLDGTSLAALTTNLAKLSTAKGIVFDLRGPTYPLRVRGVGQELRDERVLMPMNP